MLQHLLFQFENHELIGEKPHVFVHFYIHFQMSGVIKAISCSFIPKMANEIVIFSVCVFTSPILF